MQKYLCPVCRSPRKAKLRDHISWGTHFQMATGIALISAIAYLATGPALAMRVVFFYLPLWGVLEFIHGVRVRDAARCPSCDFDPVLYRRDWKAARAQVEKKLGGALDEHMKLIQERRKSLSPASAEAAAIAAVASDTEANVGTEAAKTPQAAKTEPQSSLF